MPNANVSDLELVMRLRAGKHDALTDMFRRYWQSLYFTAFYKLKSHELAEEIVQELFTELWDKRGRLFVSADDHFDLKSYLDRAVKNKVLNHIRRLVYDEKYWQYCKTCLPFSENSTHELAEFNDLEQNLQMAVEQLPGKTKEIFVLHKLKGIPVRQISRDLNLSEKAVGYHLTKSVRKLRLHLKDFI